MKLSTQFLPKPGYRWIAAFFLAHLIFFNVSLPIAWAGPENAQVVNGKASIQRSGYNTTITVSDKAIINYSRFDIARPETVQFIQPGSSASVLNRILSTNPTNINGTLLANGRVFFVNPAGVYIGAGARINVNQLVASGLSISDSDFINGRYNFVGGNGAVINEGDISAEKAYLIGKQVTNSGTISCPAGYVVMAAGNRVFLGEPGSEIVLEMDESSLSEPAGAAGSGASVLNEGVVKAAGGIIALAAAGDIYSQAISNVGSLSTSVGTGEAGQIRLAAAGGDVTNTGTIEASGSKGGLIAMEGARVGQFGTVHADGAIGDGGNVDLTAGDVVALSSQSLTTANAGISGNGGDVKVYSPDTALFRNGARIEARGGSESGDGGFIEVSGKNHVEIFGWVDAGASNGNAGSFLIDPTDLTIAAAPAVEDITDDGDGIFTSNADDNIILDTTIEGYLNGGTSVVLDTSDGDGSGGGLGGAYEGDGDIIQNADAQINKTLGGNATLTLTAERHIDLNGGIVSASGALGVVLNAGGNVAVNAPVTTNGGTLTSSGVDFVNTGGAITAGGGNVDLSGHTGVVNIDAAINAGGSIDIDGSSINIASDIGGVGITFGNAVIADGTGSQTFEAGAGTLTAASITKATGDLTLGGDAAINVSGNLTSARLTLDDDVTATGAGSQSFEAGAGTLTAASITKATGDLTLGGDAAVSVSGDLSAVGLTLNDDVTATGTGSQSFEAGTGTLTAASITKATGDLTLGGDAAVSVSGDLSAVGLTLDDDVTATGAGSQSFEAGAGTLTAASITKATGDLTLGGDTAINVSGGLSSVGLTLNDDVTVTGAGSQSFEAGTGTLTAASITKATGDLTLGGDVAISVSGDLSAVGLTLDDDVTATGAGSQSFEAGAGTLTAASITKATGDLTLGGDTAINVSGGLSSVGLTLDDDVTATGTGSQAFEAGAGTLTAAAITKATGDLTLGGDTLIALDGTVAAFGGSLTVQGNARIVPGAILSAGDSIVVAAGRTLTGEGDLTLFAADGGITEGAGDDGKVQVSMVADNKTLTLTQNETLDMAGFSVANDEDTNLAAHSTGGSVISTAADAWQSISATAQDNIELSGSGDIFIASAGLSSTSGGVMVVSTGGTISTPGAGGVLDAPMRGYSDGSRGIPLPFESGAGTAAIVIRSESQDLSLGANATLTANGVYSLDVDERLGVDFDTSPSEGGDPIDVAIYLGSYRPDPTPSGRNVAVDSTVSIAENATIVIDAFDTVTFGNTFESSVFNLTNRLEVVSRQSETLQELKISEGVFRLPYALNPDAIRSWFGGTYVLRGKQVFAEVLSLTDPVPLVSPRPLEPEVRDEVEGPDVEALVKLLNELGLGVQPYVTEAYAASLSTDLRLYSAAEKLQQLIPILEDTDGTHVAGLRVATAQFFPTLDVISDEKMDSFAQELTSHKGDGTDFDLAARCIAALVEYVNILGNDIGWPADKSIGFVMSRYIPKLTEGDEIRIAVIQMQLQKAFGV